VGVAVADEAQAGCTSVGLDGGRKPNPAHAASHLIGVVASSRGERLKLAPKFDDVAAAIFPILEKLEIGNDLAEIDLRMKPFAGAGRMVSIASI
jgi:hypothetical protein